MKHFSYLLECCLSVEKMEKNDDHLIGNCQGGVIHPPAILCKKFLLQSTETLWLYGSMAKQGFSDPKKGVNSSLSCTTRVEEEEPPYFIILPFNDFHKKLG